MTAGSGISHSEVSTDEATVLHGVQLWVALPDGHRHTAPAFTHYVPPVVHGQGWDAQVFLGSMFDHTSPVETFSPLLGAEVIVDGGTTITPVTDETFEYGVLVDFGTVHVNGVEVTRNQLAYVAPGEPLAIQADDLAHLLLLGGPPFGEEIVMWWNFVGRDHSEIVEARADWMAQVTDNNGVLQDSQEIYDGRFGIVEGDHLPPIPAPALPNARLKPRALTAGRSGTSGASVEASRSRGGLIRRVGANRHRNHAESAQRGIEITPSRHTTTRRRWGLTGSVACPDLSSVRTVSPAAPGETATP